MSIAMNYKILQNHLWKVSEIQWVFPVELYKNCYIWNWYINNDCLFQVLSKIFEQMFKSL